MAVNVKRVDIVLDTGGVLQTRVCRRIIGRVDDDNSIVLEFTRPEGFGAYRLVARLVSGDKDWTVDVGSGDRLMLDKDMTANEVLAVQPIFYGTGDYQRASGIAELHLERTLPGGVPPDEYLRLYDSAGFALYDADNKALYAKEVA